MSLHVCKSTHFHSHSIYEVLVDGVKYRCTEDELVQLRKGVDPHDLELPEINDDGEEEDDE